MEMLPYIYSYHETLLAQSSKPPEMTGVDILVIFFSIRNSGQTHYIT